MNLRQNETFAFARPQPRPEFRTPALPLRTEPAAAEHDFLVQNWRPDLVNETALKETFFTVDRP